MDGYKSQETVAVGYRNWDVGMRNITNRKLAHEPITDTSYIRFSDSRWTDLENPISLDFDAWPGVVQVVVRVYDHDDNAIDGVDAQLVDIMRFDVTDGAYGPDFIYQEIEGERPGKKSDLEVVFRFDCGMLYTGRQCDNKCTTESQLDCTASETIPPISADCFGLTTDSSSAQSSTTTLSSENTSDLTTSVSTKHAISSTTETTTAINRSTAVISTFESSSISSHHSKLTTEITLSTSTQQLTPEMTPPPRLHTLKKQTTVSTDATTLDPPSFSPTLGSPFLIPEMNDWKIILGCVLGGVALAAIIGYLIFFNRQKSLLKRKEIYSVTPEMLSIVEENGITVRSDIPFETNSTST
ncbi:uncharacterized protein LOC121388795 [Gigantopelta aegis]|uniref:uncharacterized protein LOC121388795 n=1 Tax=Gigantopelta aegis TaxID=1735272 RepID=UPI001B88CA01|nr:uncharacterized protein LOC121388795 [Gigantopelta aegis]